MGSYSYSRKYPIINIAAKLIQTTGVGKALRYWKKWNLNLWSIRVTSSLFAVTIFDAIFNKDTLQRQDCR